MSLHTKVELSTEIGTAIDPSKINKSIFSKDYVDFLSEAGWTLEKKFPSNINYYSDLLEDTEWETTQINVIFSKHYRRDLDALS